MDDNIQLNLGGLAKMQNASVKQKPRVMLWLHVKLNYFELILNLFQCFISHVTDDGGYLWNKMLK